MSMVREGWSGVGENNVDYKIGGKDVLPPNHPVTR